MAYINQDGKAKIAANIKPLLKKYNLKGSLSIRNNMVILLTLKAGSIDFIENYIDVDAKKTYGYKMAADNVEAVRKAKTLVVNPYHYKESFSGVAKEALAEIFAALKSADWYDRSDRQSDYFDIAYYFDVNIGKRQKPYELVN